MKSVLLRLEGPLQAWSSQGKLGVRDTECEPTKSGILGLVGAALGMERYDETTLQDLCTLALAVRVDRAGSLLRDYHTAGGGRFRGRNYFVFGAGDCIPSERYYLQGASFVAALCGADSLVHRVAEALASPRWPLFLGRRACPPAEPVLIGVVEHDAVAAARHAPLADRVKAERLRLVVDAAATEDAAEVRYDVPLSFREGARQYTLRHVRTEWIARHAASGTEEASA